MSKKENTHPRYRQQKISESPLIMRITRKDTRQRHRIGLERQRSERERSRSRSPPSGRGVRNLSARKF